LDDIGGEQGTCSTPTVVLLDLGIGDNKGEDKAL
jgi:hypothetical protein